MKKRIIQLVVAGFAAAAGATVLAAPAEAACTDRVCVYRDWNGSGPVAGFTTADNNFANNRFSDGSPVNDQASSASSTFNDAAYFYTDSYWRGFGYRVLSNGQPQNFAWDNQVSSFRYSVT
jgi:hypothetical protein